MYIFISLCGNGCKLLKFLFIICLLNLLCISMTLQSVTIGELCFVGNRLSFLSTQFQTCCWHSKESYLAFTCQPLVTCRFVPYLVFISSNIWFLKLFWKPFLFVISCNLPCNPVRSETALFWLLTWGPVEFLLEEQLEHNCDTESMSLIPQYHLSVVSRHSFLQEQRRCVNQQGELSSLNPWYSNSRLHQNHLKGSLKSRLTEFHSRSVQTQPVGCMQPTMGVNVVQHKIVNLLKTLWDFFVCVWLHVTMYLACGPRQLFFQCGAETPNGCTPLLLIQEVWGGAWGCVSDKVPIDADAAGPSITFWES